MNSSIVSFEIGKGISTNGLWHGPKSTRRAVVWVHGLGSSTFSMLNVVEKLVDKNTAVLTFNNRGHDVVSRLGQKKKGKPRYGGAAHEVFIECVDDIEGAIRFAKKQRAKEIYLAGHSTGCQKSIYWAAKEGRGVKGIILLAPVSDRAAGISKYGAKKVATAIVHARTLTARGKKHQLLPNNVWPELFDAQRFLSLYAPDSVEEIFPYAQKGKRPILLQKVKIPILTLWAEKDEYSDKKVTDITAWFTENIHAKNSEAYVIKRAPHSFKKREREVVQRVRRFLDAH